MIHSQLCAPGVVHPHNQQTHMRPLLLTVVAVLLLASLGNHRCEGLPDGLVVEIADGDTVVELHTKAMPGGDVEVHENVEDRDSTDDSRRVAEGNVARSCEDGTIFECEVDSSLCYDNSPLFCDFDVPTIRGMSECVCCPEGRVCFQTGCVCA